MEIEALKLADARQEFGIREVAEHVRVEMPAVRVGQRREGGDERGPEEPARGPAPDGVDRSAIKRRKKEAGMDVRPQRREDCDFDGVAEAEWRARTLGIEERRQQEEPTEDVRPGQPMDVAGGEQQGRHGACQQEIAIERPLEPEPQPDARGDGGGIEKRHSGEAGGAIDGAGGDIRHPFPREPGLAGASEGIGIGARQIASGEDGLTRSDVPSGIRIAKQLPIALEEEQAIEERDASGDQRQVRQQPCEHLHRPHIDRPRLRGRGADARQVPRDALVQADNAL